MDYRIQLSNSTSKQQYSFGKSERFKTIQHKSNIQYYDVPAQLNKRGIIFGKGQRSQLSSSDSKAVQRPHVYSNVSTFDKNNSKGYSMAKGRSYIAFGSANNQGKGIPSPMDYNFNLSVLSNKKSSNMFSIPKHKGRSIYNRSEAPAPGLYNPQLKTADGVYVNSLHRSSSAASFTRANKSHLQNIQTQQAKIPGPGQYEASQFNKRGFIASGKSRSITGGVISTQKKKGIADIEKQTPGPGQYELQTEFGFYESQTRVRTQQSSRVYRSRMQTQQ